MKYLISIIFTITALTIFSVSKGETLMNEQLRGETDTKINDDIINKLSNTKIFFGHQSVGGNIIEGIESLLDADQKTKLNIIKSNDPDSLLEPAFVHFYMGENGNPLLKIKEFSDSINGFHKNLPDLAIFKFCYLDIDKNTNVDQLFHEYAKTIADLKQAHPEVSFIHTTVPLTVKDSFLRGFVKKIIGRPDNNINRAIFNEMLLNEYSGKEPVFDLATIESTRVDGTRVSMQTNGVKYYALADEYAADSGHLNALGQQMVAKKLIEFIINQNN